jgi:hypothetical protein
MPRTSLLEYPSNHQDLQIDDGELEELLEASVFQIAVYRGVHGAFSLISDGNIVFGVVVREGFRADALYCCATMVVMLRDQVTTAPADIFHGGCLQFLRTREVEQISVRNATNTGIAEVGPAPLVVREATADANEGIEL